MPVIWERPEPRRRQNPPLTRAAVVAAARALADAKGLPAVTLRGVAARLGVLPMRLYSHVDSRDELLDLMADAVCGEIALPPVPAANAAPTGIATSTGIAASAEPGGDWRADLRAIAEATVTVARRHPWFVTLLGSRPPYGPNGLAYQERLYAAVDRPGRSPDTLVHVVNAVLGYVVGCLHLELLKTPPGADAHVPEPEQLDYLARATAGGRHPALARLFREGRQLSADECFRSGLEIVLDGVAHHLATTDHRRRSPG